MTSINFNTNPYFKPQHSNKPKETELGLFYTNDMHGDVKKLSKFKTAHDEFKKSNNNVPSMTLAGGDCLFGTDKARSNLMVKLFNLIGLDALALGNHEFASGSKNLSDNLEKAEFKSVSANLDIDEESPLQDRLKDKKIVKSAVFMKGGTKFAVIGASPFDSYINIKDKHTNPMDLDNTIKAINNEVKELEKQGIDKIILCSHVGYGEKGDLKIAQETEGIDIIVGGHTHTEIDGVNKETTSKNNKVNLLTSKRNEPVIITQAGGMNNNVGYLNVVFDEKGVIKADKIVNRLINTENFQETAETNNLIEGELGKKITLSKNATPYLPKTAFDERFKNNPLANLFTDTIIDAGKDLGVQVSLIPAASIRGGVDKEITNYDIKYSMLPFNAEVKCIDITEKDFVEVLKRTAGGVLKTNYSAENIHCGGMNCKIDNSKNSKNNDNNILELNVQGTPIDVKNPSETKTIKAALGTYLFDVKNTADILQKYKDSAISLGKEQDIFTNYLNKTPNIDLKKGETRIDFTTNYENYTEFSKQRNS